MNYFLSHLHKELRHTHVSRRGATHAPNDVPTGIHKEYLRMERITLPPPHVDIRLADALTKRHSVLDGDPTTQISHQEIGSLLGLALGAHADGRRHYPSGGRLYPTETYVVSSADAMVAHYHPSAHALEKLWPLPEQFHFRDLTVYGNTLPISMLLVFTAMWARSSAKYGDLAYLHALLEVGHMSQNVLLLASALDIAARPLAGFKDEAVIKLLDIDEIQEQPVLVIALCKASRKNRQTH